MNFRYNFSIVLMVLGIIAAIMSFRAKSPNVVPPEEILSAVLSGNYELTSDELAAAIVNQDPGLLIVDIRNAEDYKASSLPGAVNLPFTSILDEEGLLSASDNQISTVLYGNNEVQVNQAWMLARQIGIQKVYILAGGLPSWDSIIMKSAFTGETISPQENALYEKRYKARRLFVQWNAMPDSLKAGFFAARQMKEKELVGGCE
jgi:rhodanese-related sulfurtransferase